MASNLFGEGLLLHLPFGSPVPRYTALAGVLLLQAQGPNWSLCCAYHLAPLMPRCQQVPHLRGKPATRQPSLSLKTKLTQLRSQQALMVSLALQRWWPSESGILTAPVKVQILLDSPARP